MIRLEVGRVLRFADEDRYDRLLWRPEIADGFFCIDSHGSYAAPRFRRRQELEELIADGALAQADAPWEHPAAG